MPPTQGKLELPDWVAARKTGPATREAVGIGRRARHQGRDDGSFVMPPEIYVWSRKRVVLYDMGWKMTCLVK